MIQDRRDPEKWKEDMWNCWKKWQKTPMQFFSNPNIKKGGTYIWPTWDVEETRWSQRTPGVMHAGTTTKRGIEIPPRKSVEFRVVVMVWRWEKLILSLVALAAVYWFMQRLIKMIKTQQENF